MTEIIEKDKIIAFLLENYTGDVQGITVKEADATRSWTIADLFIRRWLNDMDDAPGWGLANVGEVYRFLCEHKASLITHDMVNKTGTNNSGFPLWENYEFDN